MPFLSSDRFLSSWRLLECLCNDTAIGLLNLLSFSRRFASFRRLLDCLCSCTIRLCIRLLPLGNLRF
jgi:hypothetical protein